MGLNNKLREWRRYLHEHPEISFQEYKTTQYLAAELEALGVTVELLQPTGVIGIIKGNKEGPTVALRADIDALALQDIKAVSYKSQVPGVMHACGHDGHSAILLGVAETLMKGIGELPGTVILIFQPAEENPPGGALRVIEAGYLRDVQWIFGLHLWTGFATGIVGLAQGPVMANADEFVIEIQGKGGHGSMPQETVDAALVASQVVVALQTIVSRSINPLEPAVVSVGELHSGTGFNIIAQEALIRGTYRSLSQETRLLIEQRIEEIATGICASFGANCTVQCLRGYPALINPPAGVELLKQAAVKVVGVEQIIAPSPVLGGEDFGYYLEQVQGAFMFLGAGSSNAFPHHHPAFDFAEEVMETGVEILVQATLDALQK
ncbi:MAG TPA: amidohydrolase [Candidatus Deferrimicrobium sp.]|nr:amidohydrolase [Candidatus Deferrimicrobium sp.]